MRTGHKQGETWFTCFSKIGTAEAEQLFLLSVCVQKNRNAAFSCYDVTPLPRATAPPCLLLFIKDPLKEEGGLGLGLWLFGALAFGFGFCFLFFVFWCGKLLEGKRITEGKELLKGNC
jgi:hypothetical protein